MTINCVWEHNGNDTLLYAIDHIGAYTRGESLEIAKAKMPGEIVSYLKWLDEDTTGNMEIIIAGKKDSDLAIKDADSDVLFESEKALQSYMLDNGMISRFRYVSNVTIRFAVQRLMPVKMRKMFYSVFLRRKR